MTLSSFKISTIKLELPYRIGKRLVDTQNPVTPRDRNNNVINVIYFFWKSNKRNILLIWYMDKRK